MFNLKVVGIDLAFANMGLCRALISQEAVKVTDLRLVKTEGFEGKSVRKNSSDLRRAQELQTALISFCEGATLAFCEIPHGSQSARASWSLGISVGVLASCKVPVIQLSALEVKMATVGKRNASKAEMIAWAVSHHPDAQWLRHGKKLVAANEHLADAIACIYAGVQTDEFKRLVAMMSQNTELPVRRKFIRR